MLSSDDYNAAAKALAQHAGDPKEVEFYERLAADARAREAYALALGRLSHRGIFEPPMPAGTRIMIKLLEDGWIPPEGLF